MPDTISFLNTIGARELALITLIILVLEGLPAFLFLWITRKPLGIIHWFLTANLVSMPLVYFLLPHLYDFPMLMLTGFALSWVVESVFLGIFLRKHYRIHVVIGLTFAINFFSLIVGSMLYMLLAGLLR